MTLTESQKRRIDIAISKLPYLTLLLLKQGSIGALIDLASRERGGGAEDYDDYVITTAAKHLMHKEESQWTNLPN